MQLYARSRAIQEKTLGSDHPDVGETINNMAGLLYQQARVCLFLVKYKKRELKRCRFRSEDIVFLCAVVPMVFSHSAVGGKDECTSQAKPHWVSRANYETYGPDPETVSLLRIHLIIRGNTLMRTLHTPGRNLLPKIRTGQNIQTLPQRSTIERWF